jgi:hypothetical protein
MVTLNVDLNVKPALVDDESEVQCKLLQVVLGNRSEAGLVEFRIENSFPIGDAVGASNGWVLKTAIVTFAVCPGMRASISAQALDVSREGGEMFDA